MPLRAHARQGRAVAAGHRPRRHRDADGGRAAIDGAPSSRRAARWGARRSSSACGNGRPRAAAPSSTSSSGWVRRATGRANASPWTRGCRKAVRESLRPALQRKADLQGQAAGQLGPQAADRDFRSGSRAGRDQGPPLAPALSARRQDLQRRGPVDLHRRRHHAAGDDAGRHRGGGASRRRALQARWSARTCILPLVGRQIPIIADEYSDPEKGSGAVKITPAHDFNDFEVGKRHNLPQINIFEHRGQDRAKINAVRAAKPSDLERDAAAMRGPGSFRSAQAHRRRLEEMGLVEKIEPHAMPCRMATARTW